MPSKRDTGGAARPTGETAVRRYTAAEWAERERKAQEAVGAGPGEAAATLRLVLSPDGARVEVAAHLPLPGAEGRVGQTIALDPDDTVALVQAAERVLAAHRARAEGAAILAWARHIAAGEV